ncbi:MAG: hypothetical protein V4670_09610 [Bacteroidota bacterium]
MMKIYTIFEKKLFIIFILITFFLWLYLPIRDTGINRTVGWFYQMRYLSYYFTFSISILSLFVYAIFGLLKYKTHRFISILQTITILLYLLLDQFHYYDLIMDINFVSLILLIANIIFTIKKQKTKLSI